MAKFFICFITICSLCNVGQCLNTGNCDIKITFDSDVDMDGDGQNIPTMIRSYHVTSPMACISDCCNDESCTNVAYSLSGARDESEFNCILYECKDYECPTKSSMGRYVYDINPKGQETESTSSTIAESASAKTPTALTPTVASNSNYMTFTKETFATTAVETKTTSKISPTTGIMMPLTSSITTAPTYTTTILRSTAEIPTSTLLEGVSVSLNSTLSGSDMLSRPQSPPQTTSTFILPTPTSVELPSVVASTKLPHPLLSDDSTSTRQPISTTKNVVPTVETGSPTTISTKTATTKGKFETVSIYEITTDASGFSVGNNQTTMYISPFRHSYGILITFAVFGLMILLTTIYVISTRLQESLKNYRYRHYRKVEYLMNDHRWHA
ncbi:uncharacterized protein LOC120328401 [Styela clava]